MGTKENKATLKRYYDEIFNGGDLSHWDDLMDKSYVMHLSGTDQKGIEGARQVQASRQSFAPDGKATIEQMVAEGDMVVIRGVIKGTHTGESQGLAPTGKKFTREFMAFYRFKDGKIAEGWTVHNVLGMFQQLGVTPPATPPARR